MRRWLTTATALRVPQVTAVFWLIKWLSTGFGESASDYLVHAMAPEIAVLIGFVAFVAALLLQFAMQRYVAPVYWLTVVMVGTFGTMAADVLHVGLGLPYVVSAGVYAVALAVVFVTWWRVEGTLSIHSIDTARREAFYWAAVVATFAMGTALGDLAAYTLNLGYFTPALIFAVLIAVPAFGWAMLRWNPVLTFWWAYIVTRPLGASLADGFGKPKSSGGLGIGNGAVAGMLLVVIAVLVAVVTVTRHDVQRVPAR